MASDLVFRLVGGAANADPDASLGGVMSSVAVGTNLFDRVAVEEAAAGDTEYRAVDIFNAGDAIATSVEFYIDTTTTLVAVTSGKDASNENHTAVSNLETVADEGTAPASPAITFADNSSASTLALGNIDVGKATRIWVKRDVAAATGNKSGDGADMYVNFA